MVPQRKRKDRGALACLLISLLGILLSGCATAGKVPGSLNPQQKNAYEFNRQGMIKMSMALFDEAIDEFKKAFSLFTDYQIRDQPLMYTPLFMAGWAYEKIGDEAEACRYFKRFLSSAPPEYMELSKADHAKEYLKNCSP